MKNELNKLINKMCAEWGFCIPESESKIILSQENIEADPFACAILEAEDMNPETEIKWRRKIRNEFVETFGSKFG